MFSDALYHLLSNVTLCVRSFEIKHEYVIHIHSLVDVAGLEADVSRIHGDFMTAISGCSVKTSRKKVSCIVLITMIA